MPVQRFNNIIEQSHENHAERTAMLTAGMGSIYLPIYSTAREFRAKILLAAKAAERGFDAYLGTEIAINNRLPRLAEGVYFAKDVQSNKVKWFKEVKKHGHTIVATDEEGIFVRDYDVDEQWFVRARISRGPLELIEAFLAPGPHQCRAIVEAFPELASKIHASGNPRLDLIREEYLEPLRGAGRRLRAELGTYVLINSSFGEANYRYGTEQDLLEIYRKALNLSADELKFFEEKIAFQKRLVGHFVSALDRLAKAFPEVTFCVRPHPMEKHDYWLKAVDANANVCIRVDGTALEWSAGAEVTIHNSCTTGLEAALAGFNVVSFRPEKSNSYESQLVNSVSRETDDVDGLIEIISSLVADPGRRSIALSAEELEKRVKDRLEFGVARSASDRIVDVFEQISPSQRAAISRERSWSIERLVRSLAFPMQAKAYQLMNREVSSVPKSNLRVLPFNASDVRRVIDGYRDGGGHFSKVCCQDISADFVRVFAKS